MDGRAGRAAAAADADVLLRSLGAISHTHLKPDVTPCVQGVWTDELVVQPRPLTKTYFSDRSDAVDAKASELIFKALSKAKLLNATGYLVDDPRRGARCH